MGRAIRNKRGSAGNGTGNEGAHGFAPGPGGAPGAGHSRHGAPAAEPGGAAGRLGIFGGSFNPVHNGHLHAARLFKSRLNLDLVLLVPSAAPFYKNTSKTEFRHRLSMCRLAAQKIPGLAVCDLEGDHPDGMYTRDLVLHLREQYEDSTLFLLMGDDVFNRFTCWPGYAEIAAAAKIAVLQREPGNSGPPSGQRDNFTEIRIAGNALPISSTAVREAVLRNQSVNSLVPPEVAAYIYWYGLYASS